jgi:hypothetical protein
MALTSSKVIYKQHFGPFMPGVHIAPYPYCLHCKVQAERVRSQSPVFAFCTFGACLVREWSTAANAYVGAMCVG